MSRSRAEPRGSSRADRGLSRLVRHVFLLVGLAAAILAAYAPVLGGVFVWDDTYVVEQNYLIRDWSNLPEVFGPAYFDRAERGHYNRSGEQSYRPVSTLSHFLDYSLFGLDPRGYHGTNLLYHALACATLAQLLLSLGIPWAGAVFGALLFALHPLNSEAVITVSYREDLLAAAGLFAALSQHLRGRTWAALLLFLLSAFAKQSAVVFLPLVVLADALQTWDPARPGTALRAVWKNRWRGWLVYALGTAFFLWIVLVVLIDPNVAPTPYPGGSPGTGLATAARILLHDLRLVFWPAPLRFHPDLVPSTTWLDPHAAAGLLTLTACLAAAWRWLPAWPARFLGLWFFVALLPIAGIYPLPNPVAERYLYLPLAGPVGLAAWGCGRISGTWRGSRPRLWAVLLLPVLVLCGICDRQRSRIMTSDEAFYREMLRTNPRSDKGQMGLGSALFAQGRIAEASAAWEQAAAAPDSSPIALHNLALAYLHEGRRGDAYRTLERVLELQPSFVESRYQMAVLWREDGRYEEAETEQLKVLHDNPNFIPAKFQLAYLLDRRGERGQAVQIYESIVAVDPGYAKAWKNLGVIHLKSEDLPAAARYFRRYLALVPKDPQRDEILRVIEAGEAE